MCWFLCFIASVRMDCMVFTTNALSAAHVLGIDVDMLFSTSLLGSENVLASLQGIFGSYHLIYQRRSRCFHHIYSFGLSRQFSASASRASEIQVFEKPWWQTTQAQPHEI